MYHILIISRFIPSTVIKSGRYDLAFVSFFEGLSSIAQNPQYFFNSSIPPKLTSIDRLSPFISFSNASLFGLIPLAKAFKTFSFVSSFVRLMRSEEHTSELQSRGLLLCLLL